MTLPRRLRPTPEQRLRTLVKGALPGLAQGQSRSLRPVRKGSSPGVVLPDTVTAGPVGAIQWNGTMILGSSMLIGDVAFQTGSSAQASIDGADLILAGPGWFQVNGNATLTGAVDGDRFLVALEWHLLSDGDLFVGPINVSSAFGTTAYVDITSPVFPLTADQSVRIDFHIAGPAGSAATVTYPTLYAAQLA